MLVGQTIGPFAIEKEIGCGAMGAVYLARYAKTGQPVALKIIAPGIGSNPMIQARFEREADILKQLRHPNIVRLFGVGKFHKSPYYAMEYIEGETLNDLLLRRGRLPWDEVVEIGKQVCAALAHAHAQGIVHRDLKPSNLMITREGTVKLTDFGIAKDLDVTQLTSANATVGTAAYMSPEQCKGERDLTHKSDLYALGVVLYELLTGRKPFQAENVIDMFLLHAKRTPERPSRLVLDIPVWLDNLVMHLLEKRPEQRPLDAAMVAQVLEEVRERVDSQSSAGIAAAPKAARKSKDAEDKEAARTLLSAGKKKRKKKKGGRRQIGQALGLVAGLALVVAGIVYFLWPAGPEKRYREGIELVQKGDALVDQGDTDAGQAAWYDAERKLETLAADPGNPLAEQAKAQLDHVRAGTLYLKVQAFIKDKKDWNSLKKESGFDAFQKHQAELLDRLPADDPFVVRARTALAALEGPALLEQVKTLASEGPVKWPEALAVLSQLRARYPESDAARQVSGAIEWLEAYASALNRVEQARKSKTPRAPSLNLAEEDALAAIELELAMKPEQAKIRWTELSQRPLDNAHFRPWVLLAQEWLKPREP